MRNPIYQITDSVENKQNCGFYDSASRIINLVHNCCKLQNVSNSTTFLRSVMQTWPVMDKTMWYDKTVISGGCFQHLYVIHNLATLEKSMGSFLEIIVNDVLFILHYFCSQIYRPSILGRTNGVELFYLFYLQCCSI